MMEPWPRRAGTGAAVAVVFLPFVLSFPGDVLTARLDPSWMGLLANAASTDLTFGRDLVFSYGPYGHLITPLYDATWLPWKVAFGVARAVLVSGILAVAFLRAPGWVPRIAIAAGVVYAGAQFDVGNQAALLLGLVTLVGVGGATSLVLGTALVVLGLGLALTKTTFLVLGPICLAWWLAVAPFRRRRVWPSVASIAGASAALAALWIVAGQPPGAFPDFVRGMVEITSGYEAMGGAGVSRRVFEFAFAALAIAAVAQIIALAPLRSAGPALAGRQILMAGLICLFTIQWWKFGFTREDHAIFFFGALPFLSGALCIAFPEPRTAMRGAATALVACAAIGASTLVAEAPLTWRAGASAPARRVAGVVGAVASPSSWQAAAERRQAEVGARVQLPRIAARVGTSAVVVQGNLQGAALLNGLRIVHPPVFQSYAAYSSGLMERNAAWYRRPSAPPYLMTRFQPIDGRPPLLADALAWWEVLHRYEPLFTENGFWLMQRRAGVTPAEPLATRTLALNLGTGIALGELRGCLVWLRVGTRTTPWGAVRRVLHRRPDIRLQVRSVGRSRARAYRLPAGMGEPGFLLSPLLETAEDAAALSAGRWPGSAVTRVAFLPVKASAGGIGDVLDIELEVRPPPMPHDGPTCDPAGLAVL